MEHTKKFKRLLQIIIPIVIVIIISGIWVVKNNSKLTPKPSTTIENVDFQLETTTLDLEKLKSYGLPIMIDFGADSCDPCKLMEPVLKELNEELQGKVIIKFVDVWKNQSLADGFPVELIPTQFFFDKDGKPYVPADPKSSKMQMYSLKDTNEHIYTAHQGGMTKEQVLAVFKEMGLEE